MTASTRWALLLAMCGTATATAPTATDQSVTADEHALLAITLSGSDPEGDALTYAIATAPAEGTPMLAGNQATYTSSSDTDTATSDRFTFTANASTVDGAPATATITVTTTGRQQRRRHTGAALPPRDSTSLQHHFL